MTTLAIELNDASIAVARSDDRIATARSDGLIATESGCAIETGDGIAFGDAALRSSRLRPRDANDRYWADLGVGPLARPISRAKSAADLAHAQLLQLWRQFGEATDEVLLAVPGSFHREKLSLLLGIANACEMPVTGLVDAAVAACPCPYPGWDSIHVEAYLHEFGITRIGFSQRGGVDEAIAESFETVNRIGVAQLRERWARRIAAAFVAQTRFDPLIDGQDRAAPVRCASRLGSRPSADCRRQPLNSTSARRPSASNSRGREFVAEAADVYDRLANRVAAARRTGRGLAVWVGAVLAGLPGATERLAQIAGVRVVELPAGAGALGALACANEVRSRPGETALVKSLGWQAHEGRLPALRPDELEESVSEATHLLIRDTAHPIGGGDLNLRFGEAGQASGQSRTLGADSTDFALRRTEGGLRLAYAGDVGRARQRKARGIRHPTPLGRSHRTRRVH